MQLDFYGTLVAAALVLLLGQQLLTRIRVLRGFNIPEPVAGGLFVAFVLLAIRSATGYEIKFDPSLQTPLMLAFFATIGLSADFSALKKGGKLLGTFLVVVVGLLFIQNGVGVGLAHVLGLDPLMGLLAGSITLSGGHGTGSAWSSVFQEKYGIAGAAELAMACATFGLVLGGVLGGPVARYLVKKVKVPGADHNLDAEPHGFELPEHQRPITASSFIGTLALVALSLLGGTLLAGWLKGSALELPTFVCVLFAGVLLRNGLSKLFVSHDVEREVSLMGNVSLSLFLAIALMSLKLWQLTGLAVPIFVLLIVQTLAMALFAIFVTFRVMGSNYDSVVLAAGHCGFGLGATPTAIANMQAITQRYGPSHVAFLVVPMVGAFFVDIVNAIVIKLFLALPFIGSIA